MSNPSIGARVLSVTVNLQGNSHELREVKEDRLWGRYSYGKYVANVGLRRTLDLFDRLGVQATFFIPAFEAKAWPSLVRDIAAAGHEIAAHGNAMEDHSQLGDAEAALLAEAHETVTRIVGSVPTGWRAPDGKLSEDTLRRLARLGYVYDSSFQDDDLPYSLDADGGVGMVELPQNEMLIDATLWSVRQTHERVLKTWVEEFDALYKENCYACLTIHPRSDFGSGRASRIEVVEKFIQHVRSYGDVTFKTCGELSRELQAYLTGARSSR